METKSDTQQQERIGNLSSSLEVLRAKFYGNSSHVSYEAHVKATARLGFSMLDQSYGFGEDPQGFKSCEEHINYLLIVKGLLGPVSDAVIGL